MSHFEDDGDTIVKTITKDKTKRPQQYTVIILNDDFTPALFVTDLLQDVFNMSADQAFAKMREIHNTGKAACGIFPCEIAETKATQVMDRARKEDHPLLAKHEPI